MSEDSRFDRLLAAGVGPGERAAYGSRPDQFLEWFGDPHTARTVVVLIHGGYFREQVTLDYLRPMAQALVEKPLVEKVGVEKASVAGSDAGGDSAAKDNGGRDSAGRDHAGRDSAGRDSAGRDHAGGDYSDVAVALIEYRRVGGEGGHPYTIEDIETAVEFVGEVVSAGQYGLGGVRLVVSGHSAGGSLSLTWATRQSAGGLNVVVRPLAAVSDHVAEVRDNLANGAVLAYMGATPEKDPARYLAEDPRSRVALIPSRIDVRLIHGVADQTVDIAFARGFPVPRLEIMGANHFDVVDPHSPCFDEVARHLLG